MVTPRDFDANAPDPVFPSDHGMICFTPPMQSRLALLLLTLALALTPTVFAAGKNSNKAKVSFHMETESTDNPKMIFPHMVNGRPRYFRRMPEFTTDDIAAFSPFPSDVGGDDYGVVFKFKNPGANRLAAVTNANQGRWMISQVNGRVLDAVLIDQQVSDGTFVVWKGVTLADTATLDKALPRIGQEGKKDKK